MSAALTIDVFASNDDQRVEVGSRSYHVSEVEDAELRNVAGRAYRLPLCIDGRRAAVALDICAHQTLVDLGPSMTVEAVEAERRQAATVPPATWPGDAGNCGTSSVR